MRVTLASEERVSREEGTEGQHIVQIGGGGIGSLQILYTRLPFFFSGARLRE